MIAVENGERLTILVTRDEMEKRVRQAEVRASEASAYTANLVTKEDLGQAVTHLDRKIEQLKTDLLEEVGKLVKGAKEQ